MPDLAAAAWPFCSRIAASTFPVVQPAGIELSGFEPDPHP